MVLRSTAILLMWACLIGACICQREEHFPTQDRCSNKTICSDCIRIPYCAWCFSPEHDGPRCFNPAVNYGPAGCNEEYSLNPENQLSIKSNMDLKRGSAYTLGLEYGSKAASANDVQIKPQKVKLQLRVNEMQRLYFQYLKAQDFPIDLYYLVDLSGSMKSHKDKLNTLGNQLSRFLPNITSDFRIGFGSFVNIPLEPTENLNQSCADCATSYGFKNHMSLSKDTDFFDQAVAKANVSENLDAQKGGLDALMQAVVCKSEIGWREQARHILVFSTDAGFYQSLDYTRESKPDDIAWLNDGRCHMKDNSYTQDSVRDRPTISQINQKVKDHAINVIFAVTPDQVGAYNRLAQHIEGSSTAMLIEDSRNVLDLVHDDYMTIMSTMEINDTSSDAVQISYFSSCLRSDRPIETTESQGFKVGDIVECTTEMTLKECPKDPKNWKHTIQIYPVGVSESLEVEIEMICDCPCERPGRYESNSVVCSGQGTFACGVCACNPGRYGKYCECSGQGGVSLGQESCRPNNSTFGPLCSNRGSCVCGVCECNILEDPAKVISGSFCECDNFSCDKSKGMLCSGPEHGECVCGKCMCRPEYSGPACACFNDNSPCLSPKNGEICSGKGKCVCGQCVCNVDDDQHYLGKYCEKCPTCSVKCGEFKDCVLCEVHKRGLLYNPEEIDSRRCGNCSLYPVIVEGKLEVDPSSNEHFCKYYDDDDCLYAFTYEETERILIRAQKERECSTKLHIIPTTGGSNPHGNE